MNLAMHNDQVSRFALLALVLFAVGLASTRTRAENPSTCQHLFLSGQYDECSRVAGEAIGRGDRDENWWLWGVRSSLVRGQHEQASQLLDQGLKKFQYGVRLRLLAHDVVRRSGGRKRAEAILREIEQLAGRAAWRYSDAADRVALGRAALLLGADPRQVLELFYDRVRKEKPDLRDVYLAAGELALDKHDDAVAAQSFEDGLERFPDDPDMLLGLARAYADSDPKKTQACVQAALRVNPSHIASLLFLTDHAIDAEQYGDAEELIGRVLDVDPGQPEAWAFRAVLAHLSGDSTREAECRSTALKYWSTNAVVDHLIGRKLSQKYRFAEGAAYQRRALELDSDYLAPKIQLAQDLLRLGDDTGWRLADAVHRNDRYDVTAYNLVTLRDNISKFQLIRDGQLMVRMEPREAELYGDRVLRLLRRAHDTLCEKYGLEIKEPVTVEIFPDQSDFAVRTFGMPGGAGYLGVCFGKLVTANSPASQGQSPTSWESVLWHEFCHVVTLQLTRNKMPRWLSEGISVYEERQADPAWGQSMNPQYREMILGGELVPVGKLSAAFLSPPSGRHLQFAYFESSLVVEFLVQRFGHESLCQLLNDLARDVAMNMALERHTKLTMDDLERDFQEFARDKAQQLAPSAELDRESLPKPSPNDSAQAAQWLNEHPDNLWGMMQLAALLMRERKFAEAKVPLQRAIELYPGYTGTDNPYAMLAAVHRELNDPQEERGVLRRLTELDADDVPSLLRLMELDSATEDWPVVAADAERLLGVNPLLPQPHRALARAAEQLGWRSDAIAAYRRLLLLDPDDPAEVHYRLARQLHAAGDAAAKRHVLMALEEAPRFSQALQLLLKINRAEQAARDGRGP
jgi:tetratricopeptide (TPR) repeat protein